MDGSMFKFDNATSQESVQVMLDGKPVSLPTGINVAAALLGIGEIISRISPSSHKPCSPHCLMGVCFECMMEIDGMQRQACMTEVREGMNINRHLDEEKGVDI
jgi:succinate dehydrogenase/fumarate reductase-like Fe-S protein